MSNAYWTRKRLGKLNVSVLWFGWRDLRPDFTFEVFLDWGTFLDPKHRRVTISRADWRPTFSERTGRKPMPKVLRLRQTAFVYYPKRGNDGLTNFQRAMSARRHRKGPGRKRLSRKERAAIDVWREQRREQRGPH